MIMTVIRQGKELSEGKSHILTPMATDYRFCKYFMQNVITTDNNTRIRRI